MATFLMFGKYSNKSLKEITPERTEKAISIVKDLGGTVKSMYATLGKYDLLFIVHFPDVFPDVEQAMKASVALNKLTHITFTTLPALAVEDFDEIMAEDKTTLPQK